MKNISYPILLSLFFSLFLIIVLITIIIRNANRSRMLLEKEKEEKKKSSKPVNKPERRSHYGFYKNDPLWRLRKNGLTKFESCKQICRLCKSRKYENCDGIYGCRC